MSALESEHALTPVLLNVMFTGSRIECNRTKWSSVRSVIITSDKELESNLFSQVMVTSSNPICFHR